jgi:hypothetical protein
VEQLAGLIRLQNFQTFTLYEAVSAQLQAIYRYNTDHHPAHSASCCIRCGVHPRQHTLQFDHGDFCCLLAPPAVVGGRGALPAADHATLLLFLLFVIEFRYGQ